MEKLGYKYKDMPQPSLSIFGWWCCALCYKAPPKKDTTVAVRFTLQSLMPEMEDKFKTL